MDNPYLFLVEDASDKNSPSFLFSFSTDICTHISPVGNVDLSFSLLGIRGCRGHLQEEELPQPSVMDALHPCDVIANAHWVQQSRSLNGTLVTSERIVFRMGILDLRLMLNALHGLTNSRSSISKKAPYDDNRGSHDESTIPMEEIIADNGTSMNETPVENGERVNSPCVSSESSLDLFSCKIHFIVNINKIAVILVNDSSDAQIPVINACLTNSALQWVVSSERMKFSLQTEMEAGSYNPRNAAWEPVLELVAITAGLQCEKRCDVCYIISCEP